MRPPSDDSPPDLYAHPRAAAEWLGRLEPHALGRGLVALADVASIGVCSDPSGGARAFSCFLAALSPHYRQEAVHFLLSQPQLWVSDGPRLGREGASFLLSEALRPTLEDALDGEAIEDYVRRLPGGSQALEAPSRPSAGDAPEAAVTGTARTHLSAHPPLLG